MRDYHSKNGNLGAVPIVRSIDLSLAATWWLSPVFNINTKYRYVSDDRLDLNGVASGANLRLLAKIL